MSLLLKVRVCQSRDVVSHSFKGTVYVADPSRGSVRILNKTASAIWNAVKQPVYIREIVELVEEEFNVSKPEATRDVSNFVKKYLRFKLFRKS